MSLSKRVGLLGGAVALALTGGSFADPTSEASNNELKARIAQLEKRLAAVEVEEGQEWLTEQRAAEIRSMVQETLADAETRSSLLSQGMTAGYDDGAVIASADGNWMLRTNVQLQTRFALSSQSSPGAGIEETTWGFEVPRAKFIMTGNVVSPEWFYKVEINTATSAAGATGVAGDTRTGLLDAYAGYDFGNGWKLSAGQMVLPLLREEMVDSRYQLAVERSVTNYMFTAGRSAGLALDYTGDQFRVYINANNGMSEGGVYGGTLTTSTGTSAVAADTDIALTARFEWLAMGNWDQMMDFTSPQGEETGIMVGGAIHYQKDQTVASTLDTLWVVTIDGSFEFSGANVYAAWIYGDADPQAGSSTTPTSIVLQGGYYFTEDWEGFGRYEWADQDTAASDISIITFGVNKYFAGHNAKWTTDIGIGLDTVTTAVPITDYRADATGEDGQVVIRSQLQIVF